MNIYIIVEDFDIYKAAHDEEKKNESDGEESDRAVAGGVGTDVKGSTSSADMDEPMEISTMVSIPSRAYSETSPMRTSVLNLSHCSQVILIYHTLNNAHPEFNCLCADPAQRWLLFDGW